MDQAEGLRRMKQENDQGISKGAPVSLKITSVTGGKGGVGKSNIALNLGLALMELGERICILDADLGLANIDILMGITPRFHIGHVFSGLKTLDEILITGPLGIQLIPAASGLQHLAGLSESALKPFLDQAKYLGGRFDRLLIDTPAGLSGDVITFLKNSSEILVVTTPEPTALTDAYALMKTVRPENQKLPMKLILNMCASREEGLQTGQRLLKICQDFLGFQPDLLGVVEYDPDLVRAIRRRRPFFTLFPQSGAARAVRHLARNLKQNSVSDQNDLSRFFKAMKEFIT